MGRFVKWAKKLLQAGPEDEKVLLALRIADRLSIADLRKLDSGTAHVHFSPKRKPKTENVFPYTAPDAESDKAAKEGAFGV